MHTCMARPLYGRLTLYARPTPLIYSGAAHFEEHLIDYDPASNWGNWASAAGVELVGVVWCGVGWGGVLGDVVWGGVGWRGVE